MKIASIPFTLGLWAPYVLADVGNVHFLAGMTTSIIIVTLTKQVSAI